MPQNRIIVCDMHEFEAPACRSLVKNGQETESFIVGEVDDVDVEKLRDAGAVIQMVDGPAPAPLLDRTASSRTVSPDPAIDLSRPNYYRITLADPMLEQHHDTGIFVFQTNH
jgi:hypothetical protein